MHRARLTAASVQRLASSARSRPSLRAALTAWTRRLDAGAFEREVGARLRLGATPEAATRAAARDGRERALAAAIALSRTWGADPARLLDDLARTCADEDERIRSARAASAGMVLSARLVAALPVIVAPFAFRHAPFFDPVNLCAVAVGVAAVVTGMRWMGRLVPAPPAPDPWAAAADLLAAALLAGAPLGPALTSLADLTGHDLERARALVMLGAPWHRALTAGGAASLGAVIADAVRSGAPLEPSLRALAHARRAEAAAAYEASVRRAPVRMVLPLTLCVLPGFGALAVVPLLRALAA